MWRLQAFPENDHRGQGFELDAIAAALLGGTIFTGGSGTVSGTLIGALILAFLNFVAVKPPVGPNHTNVRHAGQSLRQIQQLSVL
jgi:predicted ABC-type sugar transport system permease subunit